MYAARNCFERRGSEFGDFDAFNLDQPPIVSSLTKGLVGIVGEQGCDGQLDIESIFLRRRTPALALNVQVGVPAVCSLVRRNFTHADGSVTSGAR